MSLAGSGDLSADITLTLVNDKAFPNPNNFYATDSTGARGWWLYGTAALVNVPVTGDASNTEVVLGSDTRLSDTRVPKAHYQSHAKGGPDEVYIEMSQVVDLPRLVSTSGSGFMPKLTGVSTDFFRGDGSYGPVVIDPTDLLITWDQIVDAPMASTIDPGLIAQLNSASPIPGSGSQTQVWARGDNSWQVLPDTTYISNAFGIPASGASTTVTINPSVHWPGILSVVYFDDGTSRGFLEISATGTGPFSTVTLTNRGYTMNAPPGTSVNSGAMLTQGGLTPGGTIPLADTTAPGLLAKVSGSVTDYVGGDNACHPLPVVPLADDTQDGLLAKVSGVDTDYVGGDNACHPLPIIDYSTTEQWTNQRWLDGKKIYQQTFSVAALPNNTTLQIAHGITFMSLILDVFGFATNGNMTIPMPSPKNSALGNEIALYADKTNISMDTTSDYSFLNGYVTLRYTCTNR
jgi:hypothetical protein